MNTARVSGNGITTRTARAEVRIVQFLPQTGVGRFTASLLNNSQFLRPWNSSDAAQAQSGTSDAAIPMVVWMTVAILGFGVGGNMSRKLWM